MHRVPTHRSVQLVAVALVAASLAVACGRQSGEETGSTSKAVYGLYYWVVVSRPQNGTVTSADGRIRCGTVYAACSASFTWKTVVTLTATPDAGYGFQAWAGDCSGTGTCTLSTTKNGADKSVAAVFAPLGQVGHPNFTSPADHGPAYFDFVGRVPGYLNCASAMCHGADLNGAGIAPSCHACHLRNGWTGWQTNCSFCHGTASPATQAGYDVGAHPTWSAPPDAISQRLTGTAAPDRTGAHQAHLTGVTAGGQSFAAPFLCATCHAVPTTVSHIPGAAARAVVALSGAGQASLPSGLGTYDPTAGTCATYCHGATMLTNSGTPVSPPPAWAGTTPSCVNGCHGVPPASGRLGTDMDSGDVVPVHILHVGYGGFNCAVCHFGLVTDVPGVPALGATRTSHVNGAKDVVLQYGGTWDPVGGNCTVSCHGTGAMPWRP